MRKVVLAFGVLMMVAAAKEEEAKQKTYYDDLCVNPSATLDEIQKSYRRISLLIHPDKQKKLPRIPRNPRIPPRSPPAPLSDAELKARTAMFQKVEKAYRVLSNETLRTLYDVEQGLIPIEKTKCRRPRPRVPYVNKRLENLMKDAYNSRVVERFITDKPDKKRRAIVLREDFLEIRGVGCPMVQACAMTLKPSGEQESALREAMTLCTGTKFTWIQVDSKGCCKLGTEHIESVMSHIRPDPYSSIFLCIKGRDYFWVPNADSLPGKDAATFTAAIGSDELENYCTKNGYTGFVVCGDKAYFRNQPPQLLLEKLEYKFGAHIYIRLPQSGGMVAPPSFSCSSESCGGCTTDGDSVN